MDAVRQVLGCLLKNPIFLGEANKYYLEKDDFTNELHQVIFMGLTNLFSQGLEKITVVDIENYLNQYPTPKRIFKENDGIQFLYDAEDLAQEENFKYYYDRVKKFASLRALKKQGFSIDDIYNENETDPIKVSEMQRKFDDMSIRDMFLRINSKYMSLEDHYVGRTNADYITANRNIKNLKDTLKESPEVGFPLQGDIFNTVVRGARKGKFYLCSGSTGAGKTRTMIGHCCYLAYPTRYDSKLKQWVNTGSSQKVLYIPTEMDFDEVQTIILAYLSDLNEDKILWGLYTPEEEARVDKAIEIMEQYKDNLIINKIPDPSVGQIINAIRKHHFFDGVEYAFYDYIFSSPGLLNEYRDLKVREDVVLMMLSTALKDIAVELNMFVMSGTQLSAEWESKKGGIRNQNMLRGAKSIADKIDAGAITMPVDKEEITMLARLLHELNLPNPTQVTDIYKARRSRYKNVRIWSYTDLGTGRIKDLFMTDANFNIIKMDQIEIKIEDDFNQLIVDTETGEILEEEVKEIVVETAPIVETKEVEVVERKKEQSKNVDPNMEDFDWSKFGI